MMHTGFSGTIGNTPLIELPKLSAAIGRRLLGKAEFLNPGGSVKDRAARGILDDAERRGKLAPGGTIVEGTAGNTGIALALLGNARGYRTIICIPDDQSDEKFADAHAATTGPELWEQTGGMLDAFVAAAGTGGTLAGISLALKARDPNIRTVLNDPYGSSLYSYMKTGTLESEGDSNAEGIGIKRIVANFANAPIDDAIRTEDNAMVEMAYWLVREEGLFLGGSAALNVAGAARYAMTLPKGSLVATILCDGGERYRSRLYNRTWLEENDCVPTATDLSFLTV